MKANQVLQQYAAGNRNFHGFELRGQSFRDRNLSGADFSDADIRGTDFTGANLRDAKFQGAKVGWETHWLLIWLGISWLLSGLIGVCSFWIAILIIFALTDLSFLWVMATTILFVLTLTVYITWGKKKGVMQWILAGILAGTVAGGIAGVGHPGIALTMMIAGATAGITLGMGVGLMAISGAVSKLIAGQWAGVAAVVIAGATAGIVAKGWGIAEVEAIGVAIMIAGKGNYIGWRGLKGDKQHDWVCPLAFVFASLRGTKFDRADLTNTDFSRTSLQRKDF
jgi:hypothetical protein